MVLSVDQRISGFLGQEQHVVGIKVGSDLVLYSRSKSETGASCDTRNGLGILSSGNLLVNQQFALENDQVIAGLPIKYYDFP